jgi:ubiquinone/menaquinone biosynthesis C-methylase UbiE
MAYDATTVRNFFDQYGDREWERFGDRAQDSVNLHVHTHYLRRHVAAGTSVLDAGAGPGRFTIEIARIGANVTVFDLSPEMLDQNRRRVAEAGFERSVTAREQGDITDLSRFGDDSFDAVVCYGGPLSYVMDRADEALGELLRVAKPSAPVLLSVMRAPSEGRGPSCRPSWDSRRRSARSASSGSSTTGSSSRGCCAAGTT